MNKLLNKFIIRFVAMAVLEPYRFEPERAQHPEENGGEDSEINYRLETTDWCSCWLCQNATNVERVYLLPRTRRFGKQD